MKTQKTKIWLLEGEGKVAEFGKVMYTLLCLKWTTNKDLLSSTGQPSWEGGLRGECMAASFHHSPETITTLLTGYTLIQNRKFKV